MSNTRQRDQRDERLTKLVQQVDAWATEELRRIDRQILMGRRLLAGRPGAAALKAEVSDGLQRDLSRNLSSFLEST